HRLQPVIELLHGGAHVRHGARGVAADADQRVGPLDAGGKDAARPVIFERAADQMDAVGEERRGERVACEPRALPPDEADARTPGPAQPALAGDAEWAAHAAPLSGIAIIVPPPPPASPPPPGRSSRTGPRPCRARR